MSTTGKRIIRRVVSVNDEVVDPCPEWRKEYVKSVKCLGCGYLRSDIKGPVPNCIVEIPRSVVVFAWGTGPNMYRKDFLDLIEPYHPDGVRGPCYVPVEGRRVLSTTHETCYVPVSRELLATRGEDCRHHRCRVCKRFLNKVGWARGAIVGSYLDDRQVYQNGHDLFIDNRLADEIRLLSRFDDLRLKRVQVVKEPLDGDVLPGDPGWNGRFKERSLPKPR